jgi:hypothetical protein
LKPESKVTSSRACSKLSTKTCDVGPAHRTVRSTAGTSRLGELLTRHEVRVLRGIEERSCSHFCSGKAIRITYSESVFLALGI